MANYLPEGDKYVLPEALPEVSERQLEILRVYFDYFREHLCPPTQREAVAKLEWKCTTLSAYIEPLVRKGYLRREPGRRNLFPTERLARLLRHRDELEARRAAAPATPSAKT